MMKATEGNANMYSAAIGYALPPLSGTTTETLIPMYGSVITDSIPSKMSAMKADSGLTYSLPVSRKRSRDSINPLISFPNVQNLNQYNRCAPFTFLGEDISLQIQQQQLEIDRFIAQHTEKVRLEIDERRKRNSRRIIAAVEEGIMKKLRAKEEEIQNIGKLNWALEEKVKSLYIENQLWRDLAQTNEANANALRSNLEQVLAQINERQHHRGDGAAALMDDAQSCCGSNYYGGGADEEEEDPNSPYMLEGIGGGEKKTEKKSRRRNSDVDDGSTVGSNNGNNRWCRNCRKEESCVLLLPCRHLCLCTACGSSLHICPICKSSKNASVHVNMSS